MKERERDEREGERGREREKEGGRESEKEGGERDVKYGCYIFIFNRNDECLATF